MSYICFTSYIMIDATYTCIVYIILYLSIYTLSIHILNIHIHVTVIFYCCEPYCKYMICRIPDMWLPKGMPTPS